MFAVFLGPIGPYWAPTFWKIRPMEKPRFRNKSLVFDQWFSTTWFRWPRDTNAETVSQVVDWNLKIAIVVRDLDTKTIRSHRHYKQYSCRKNRDLQTEMVVDEFSVFLEGEGLGRAWKMHATTVAGNAQELFWWSSSSLGDTWNIIPPTIVLECPSCLPHWF